jgi:hypothetical protein
LECSDKPKWLRQQWKISNVLGFVWMFENDSELFWFLGKVLAWFLMFRNSGMFGARLSE